MDEERARGIAKQIAHGHAFGKHVAKGDDFPEVKTREDLENLIAEILIDPKSVAKELRGGRQAYWSERRQTVVVLDRFSEDGGTAYRPKAGREYFRLLR